MRPTLKDQLAWKWKVDDMTDEELVDFFTLRHDWLGRIDLWVFGNLYLLWCTVHWSWFCIWCGKYHFKITSKPCKYYQPLKSKKGGDNEDRREAS